VTESDWDDVWLSEGFATYFTLLFTEHYSGRDAFVQGLIRSRNTVFSTERNLPGEAVIHKNMVGTRGLLNQLVYQKGSWVLHMLRGQIGMDAFQAGLREYYKTYRDKNASTADLQRIMESASGQKLDWFFDQWLRRAGSPVLEGSWTFNATSGKVELELTQTQEGEPYRLPLEIAARFGPNLVSVQKIEMREKKQTFELPVQAVPTSLDLDPNTWVLMQAKIEKR